MSLSHTVIAAPDLASRALPRDRLMETRSLSLRLTEPLSDEEQVVQAMDDASPTKWHLAHTTWFFEAFVLPRFLPGYKIFNDSFECCFNSYYETVGPRHPRPQRGLLTRAPRARPCGPIGLTSTRLWKISSCGVCRRKPPRSSNSGSITNNNIKNYYSPIF